MTSSANSEAGRVLPALETGSSRFCFWLQTALAGSVFEYHRGFLALDAHPNLSSLAADRDDICLTRHHAYEAARRGLVHLVQRRLAPDTFSYLAVRRVRRDQFGNAPTHLALAVAT